MDETITLHKDTDPALCPTPTACAWHGTFGIFARKADPILWFRISAQDQGRAPEWLMESIPADLEPQEPCTQDSSDCTGSCALIQGEGFVRDVSHKGVDGEAPCWCEHHEVRDLFGAWDAQAALALAERQAALWAVHQDGWHKSADVDGCEGCADDRAAWQADLDTFAEDEPVITISRSMQKRIAAQRGLPDPVFA